MNKQVNSSIRNTTLFKLYDIENHLIKHKTKINSIKSINAKQKIKKDFSTQLNAAKQLKKSWKTAEVNRTFLKQKSIYDQNKMLYNNIIKVKNRRFDTEKVLSESNILRRSQVRTSHSVNRQNSQLKIQQQNERLMQKILTAKSPLSRIKLKTEYQKTKQSKKQLQALGQFNRSRMKINLKKLNIKTSIYLPDIDTSLKLGSQNNKSMESIGSQQQQQNQQNKYSHHQGNSKTKIISSFHYLQMPNKLISSPMNKSLKNSIIHEVTPKNKNVKYNNLNQSDNYERFDSEHSSMSYNNRPTNKQIQKTVNKSNDVNKAYGELPQKDPRSGHYQRLKNMAKDLREGYSTTKNASNIGLKPFSISKNVFFIDNVNSNSINTKC